MSNNLWITGRKWSDADGSFLTQETPVARTATGTLTGLDIRNGIITSSSAAAVTLTLPTGLLIDALLINLPVDSSFDWYVINLGTSSGAVTMAAGDGHTIVGGVTVAITTSAAFRTRKTAPGVYVAYRIAT